MSACRAGRSLVLGNHSAQYGLTGPILVSRSGAQMKFLQNRLDRRDPKLALAPVYADPGVSFVPALS